MVPFPKQPFRRQQREGSRSPCSSNGTRCITCADPPPHYDREHVDFLCLGITCIGGGGLLCAVGLPPLGRLEEILTNVYFNILAPRPAKAKRLLGWTPKHTITGDLAEYFEGYKAAGKLEAEPDITKVGDPDQSKFWVVSLACDSYRKKQQII